MNASPLETGLPDRLSLGKTENETQTGTDWSGIVETGAEGFCAYGDGTARVQRRTEVSNGSPLATE